MPSSLATIIAAIIGISVAAASAVSAYAIARRRMGGRIDTTDAATLWKESQDMRRELRDELVSAREEVEHLRSELGACRKELENLREEVAHLHAMLNEEDK